ncbi:(+)-cis,trans-nepetalactol synthase NEPS2-like [Coffea arabica]|uniref:(+)-cis,trans-nepetalactol synthase NEPS2-like n=1 Tax=Coffea arabica TaxID=13443 RepID=A0A6P6XB11_COFAR|nr:(-)-isopiperitenol/(-)-carveol dehydrogenase, mitochondrial-like [Coffea arabica]
MAEPSLHLKKLEGKVAIITGGASGIGEATARLFSTHGALLVVIADIQDEKGQKVAESIGSNNCSYVHCDVSDENQVQGMVEWTLKTHGRLDIMFANAGIFNKSSQTVPDLNLSDLQHVFSVNVAGTAACVKHAARAMIDQGIKGSIVCTASTAASRGAEVRTDYYMSKHAVLGLMRCASKQLGEHGIRVNSVSPYMVATPLVCNNLNMTVEEAEASYPLPCLKGRALKANNVADAVLFLASDDSSCITGHDLLVDGGSKI